ncbi:MAG TPA: hypothetical protein VEJ89_05580, partial [Myxococcaceae bacterium]|nr:hypothetical protein [Myxococcaceae bacterium]
MISRPARVLAVDGDLQRGSLRLAGGDEVEFPLARATGFVPAPGQEVMALLAEDGTVARVHLSAHPRKPDPARPTDVGWVSVLRSAPLPSAPEALAALVAPAGSPHPRLGVHPGTGPRTIEVVWPLMHMLLVEHPSPASLEQADTRLLTPDFSPGQLRVSLLPSAVEPGVERQVSGALADPWAPEGTLRRASRLLRALLQPHGAAVILHRAGELVLPGRDALARLGNLEDPEVRPFGAWIDWALTPDARIYRTLGMPTLGGEDVEIAVARPEAEVELDSAESALLFACHLQV